MKKKCICSILVMSMLLGLMTGCGGSKKSEANLSASESVMEEKPTIDISSNSQAVAQMVDTLSENQKNENVILSKTSLDACLCMLALGADGETSKEFKNYFGTNQPWTGYQELQQTYDNLDEGQITLAYNIWINKQSGIKLSDNYKKQAKNIFGLVPNLASFEEQNTVNDINDWISKKTNGLIPEFISLESLQNNDAMLINTLYFKADWSKKFKDYQMEDGTFTNMDGTTSDVTMLSSDSADAYLENDKATGFMKRYYVNDTDSDSNLDIVYLAILPKTEGDFTLESLDMESLIASADYMMETHIKMPKIDIEDNHSLTDTLKAAGLHSIFTENANFSKMSDSMLYITDVMQKTHIIVDENGTEAAAATGARGYGSGRPADEYKVVFLDRPFVFAIYDKTNDQFLFTAKIVNLEK